VLGTELYKQGTQPFLCYENGAVIMESPFPKKKRFREYGFRTGFLPIGNRNSISDVSGVCVGHTTKIEGEILRTGVTLIEPGVRNLFGNKIPAAISVGNGFGKLTGVVQVNELGTLEAPIALTNTLAVGPVMRGVVDIMLAENTTIKPTETINIVVGETNDGFLNNIHQDVITKEDVRRAYDACSPDVLLGNVGAGTGTRAFSWKGGIGTASRVLQVEGKTYTLGILVQTNFGGALTMLGIPIGKILHKTDFSDFVVSPGGGSCMIVLATDAPLTARQLKRVARRTFLGLARTGSILAHGSGDFAIAFTTRREGLEGSGLVGACLRDQDLTQFFLAAAEAVEEAVYDALVAAETMQGRDGNTLEALPIEEVISLLKKYTLYE